MVEVFKMLNIINIEVDFKNSISLRQHQADMLLKFVSNWGKLHDVTWLFVQPELVELVEKVAIQLMEKSHVRQTVAYVENVSLGSTVLEQMVGHAGQIYPDNSKAIAVSMTDKEQFIISTVSIKL
jgi:hypothetical protein